MPRTVHPCECEEWDHCEGCEYGIFHQPDNFPPPHGAG
jgi:hypothetical protein